MTEPGDEHDGRGRRSDPTPPSDPNPPTFDPTVAERSGRPHDHHPVDDDGTRPTDVLPRPGVPPRRPPLSEQQTTALPRRPGPPPASGRPPWAVPPGAPRVPPPGPGGYRSPLPPLPPFTGRPYPPAPTPPTPPPPARPSRPRTGARRPPAARTCRPTGSRSADAASPPTGDAAGPRTRAGRPLRKITVTRVAAARSRELTLRGVDLFHRATTADGADRSGLAHLTYAQMANYACDAALAVALANTLFLVKPEEGPGRVLLYLLITVAPFALVAPLIGPFLDRLQTGRRLALALVDGGPRPAGDLLGACDGQHHHDADRAEGRSPEPPPGHSGDRAAVSDAVDPVSAPVLPQQQTALQITGQPTNPLFEANKQTPGIDASVTALTHTGTFDIAALLAAGWQEIGNGNFIKTGTFGTAGA